MARTIAVDIRAESRFTVFIGTTPRADGWPRIDDKQLSKPMGRSSNGQRAIIVRKYCRGEFSSAAVLKAIRRSYSLDQGNVVAIVKITRPSLLNTSSLTTTSVSVSTYFKPRLKWPAVYPMPTE